MSTTTGGLRRPALWTPGDWNALFGFDKMANNGVLYHGLEVLGEGSILGGLIFAAIAVCVIEKTWTKAAAFAGAGCVLTVFGFMHGPAVGFAVTPGVALAYALLAGLLYACGRQQVTLPAAAPQAAPAE
jgi:adenine/guanine/hypoxanthine permease